VSSRSLLLLLATVLLPGIALAIVGVVLVEQQQELIDRRSEDQARLIGREMADSLAARLDREAAAAADVTIAATHLQYPACFIA